MATSTRVQGSLMGRRAMAAPRIARSRVSVKPRAENEQPARQGTTHVSDYEHRRDRLLALAEEFTHHWAAGAKEGPTEQVIRSLHTVTATNIALKSIKPLGKSEFEGMDGLRDMMTLEANREGGMRPTRVAIAATNEDDDTVFCLMEGQATVHLPMMSPTKEQGAETYTHKGWGIVKFDTLLDDTACCVTAVNERWQLSPADLALLAQHVPFTLGEAPDTLDKEAALKRTMIESGQELFPNERVRTMEFDRETAKQNMEKWCAARCTGQDETKLLTEAFDTTGFRLWDVMGVLPLVCGMKPGKEHGATPKDVILNFQATMDLTRDAKRHHDINCVMIDRAVCSTHNVGFVHWRSKVQSKGQGSQEDSANWLEGLDMHVFNSEGRTTDIFMLRDPMKPEQEMLAKLLGPKAHVVQHMA